MDQQDEKSVQSRQFTLPSLIRGNAALHANRAALIDDNQTITHADLDRRTDELALGLGALGIGHGDRIALLLLDGAPLIELFVAASKVGAIAVMLNWRLAAPEIAAIIDDATPRAIFYSGCFGSLLPDQAKLERFLVTDRINTRELGNGHFDKEPSATPIFGSDPLYMIYTSGTTGMPKGCLQSHEGTIVAGMGFALRRSLTREDRLLSTHPLFHVAGLNQAVATLVAGGAVCFVPRHAAPIELLRIASQNQCTVGSMAESALVALQLEQQRSGTNLHFRTITCGAGTGDPERLRWMADEWGCIPVGGYGQTEIGGFSTMIDFPDMLDHPTALGWPAPHIEMTILGEDGLEALDTDEGEIGIRSRAVMLGYWNKREASDAALAGGWLRTGDIGRRDPHGLFHMIGRSKELIKTGGENVYPLEVERILKMHAAIADVAVCGVTDPDWGEAVKACIVLRPGAVLDQHEITGLCREHIAGYKRPRYVEFLNALPRNSTGKIERRKLSKRAVTADQTIG